MHSLPSYTVAPAPSSRTRGFALLITITLVAFLVLILVTLASLTRVETTVAANSQQVSMARQNALAALNIALGELQKYAGPDQRATATADIEVAAPAAGAAKWTGVWGNANNPQSEAVADMASNPVRLQWLVSGNEQTAFDPATGMSTTAASFGQITTPPAAWEYGPADAINGVDASTTVNSTITVAGDPAALLVGPNTVGNNPGDEVHYVVAPLVDIKVPPSSVPGAGTSGSDVTVGKYAWWIGDEGVKARVNLVDPYVEPTPAMNNAGVAAAPASPFRLMAPQRLAVERVPGFESFPVNDQIARKILNVEQSGLVENPPGSGQFAVSAQALRERFHDITTTSSGVLADQRRGGLKRDLTFAFAQSLADYRAALDLPEPVANPLIPTTIMPANEQGPTWEQLHSFANLDGSAPIAPQPQTATQHGIYPVLAQARIGLGGQCVADGANSHFILRISPSVVLANPYNVTIAAATYRFRLDFGATSHLSTYIGNEQTAFWRKTLREVFEGQEFEIDCPDIGPGEARIFTLDTDNEPWAPVKTYRLENDWSEFSIVLNTRDHGGSTFDETVVFDYPNPPPGGATLKAKGVHPVVGDSSSTTSVKWTTTGAGPRLDQTYGSGSGGVMSWGLLADDRTMLQRIETMGYASNAVSMFGIRGEDIQNSGASIARLADAGAFSATTVHPPHPYYSQFNWRAPLISRTQHYGSNGNSLVSWQQNYYQAFIQWIRHTKLTAPFTHVEWNGVVGTNGSRALARDIWQPFDVPRTATGLVSVGQLQHFNAGGYYDITYPAPAFPLVGRPSSQSAMRARYIAATHAVGNSRAHPNVAATDVKATVSGQPYYDLSYLLNRELFDGFFFSTFPQSDPVNLATDRLANPSLQPFRDSVLPSNTAAFRGGATFSPDDVRLAARNLLLTGAFNVNSTSVAAWTAFLSSLRGTQFNSETDLEGPFTRSIHQPAGSDDAEQGDTLNAWNGFRNLTEPQISDLATRIVAEIAARGPSVSVSDFINRKLSSATAEHTHRGPLQAAIDGSDINTSFPSSIQVTGGAVINPLRAPFDIPSGTTTPYIHKEHLAKHGLEGIAGWLTQADLVQALAPILTARSDTFRIRTYGETRNPATGDVNGRAWCEAVVQRLPDYVSDSEDAITPTTSLADTDNQRFGRRFVVVDFRWLSPEDI